MNEHGHAPPHLKTRAEVEARAAEQMAARPQPSPVLPAAGVLRFELERELRFFAGRHVDVEIEGRSDEVLVVELRHCADAETLAARDAYGHAPPHPPTTVTVPLQGLDDVRAIAACLSALLGVRVAAQ